MGVRRRPQLVEGVERVIGKPSVESGTTVSEYLAAWLVHVGIRHVFTLPGGMIAAVLDAVYRRGDIEIVTMHHEQAVGFATEGVGRFTGLRGVALATAGPGATNLLTAVSSAHLDSVPAIFLVGQVQSYLLKGDRPVRQFGFQECDVLTMAAPVTKAAWRVDSPERLPGMLDDALALATSGRPGPVMLELPSDVQTMRVPAGAAPAAVGRERGSAVDPADLSELLDAVTGASRPVAVLGGGVRSAGAAARCQEFLEHLGVPAAYSITAVDVLPAGHPQRLGMIGMYGNRWVNTAVAEADLVLALGTRLDFGTIGADTVAFRRGLHGEGRPIFQVDCDAGETTRVRRIRPIVADLGDFLDDALPLARSRTAPARPERVALVAELEARWPDTAELAGCPGINPNVLLRDLTTASPGAVAFVVDCGQHLWWAAQSMRPAAGQRFLGAAGMGPCGWAFPAAIGVAHVSDAPVVLVAGDGAFQFNIQELQSVVRAGLPLKIVILDNENHGSVRQLQDAVFGGRRPAAVDGYDAPDFSRVAAAYGVASSTVSEPADLATALEWLWQDEKSPALLTVRVHKELDVYPNVPFGAPLSTMESAAGASGS